MKILLTGANGYLGQKIHKYLLENHTCDVLATSKTAQEGIIPCDLFDLYAVKNLYEQFYPDIVIHTAAIVPKTNEDFHNQVVQDVNVKMLENLVDGYQNKFVFCSSMTVYSQNLQMPVSESSADGRNLSAYGYAKYQAEKFLNSQPKITPLIIRFPGLYGAPRYKGIVYNLIHHYKYGEEISFPKVPLLWAGMHADDVAFLIVKLSLNPQGKGIFNLSYPNIYSLNRLNNLIAEISGKKTTKMISHPEFEMDLNRLNDIFILNKSFRQSIESYYQEC